MLKNSCGVIIINTDGKVLICKPTGNENYSFPKGMSEDGETFFQTAIREVYEETNLYLYNGEKPIIDNGVLIEGIFSDNYFSINNKYKNIHLYTFHSFVQIDNSMIKCNSYFQDKNGNNLPENELSIFVDIEYALTKLSKVQAFLLKQNLEVI